MDYKRPESVLVVVYTAQGEVLLLRRRHPPWFWQSVTGSLEPDESPVAAARRELFEETGLPAGRLIDGRHRECFPIIPPWRARYAPGVRHNREHWFFLQLPRRRTIRLHSNEHLDYRWFPLAQAAMRTSSRTNRKALQRLCEYGWCCVLR